MGTGAKKDFLFWDVERLEGIWTLHFSGEAGKTATLKRRADGMWIGRWRGNGTNGHSGLRARLFRVESEYPALAAATNQGRRVTCVPERAMTVSALEKPSRRLPLSAAKPLHLANHAFGIGDAVTGFYTCAEIAEQTGRRIVYHTRFQKWLVRARHPGVIGTSDPPPAGAPDMDMDYAEQLRYGHEKVVWYGQWASGQSSLGQATGLDGTSSYARIRSPPCGSVIDQEIKTVRLDFPRYVILAPFAAWEARDWPQAHWRRLAWLLDQAGFVPVAIGTNNELHRMQQTFNHSNAYWAVDHGPEWVMDSMLGADAVVGLDSGMVHVAGLLRVPVVCIHSHLPSQFLFSFAPTVRSVSPRTKCVFCRWQHDRGFNEGCATQCSALATVGPEEVMSAIVDVADGEKADQRRLGVRAARVDQQVIENLRE